MSILKDLFNDVVQIVSVPAKVATRVVDNVTGTDLEDVVDDLVDAAIIEDDEY